MSYLNALASDGLSVGLRLLQSARLNNHRLNNLDNRGLDNRGLDNRGPDSRELGARGPGDGLEPAGGPGKTAVQTPLVKPAPPSAEERAAGRADAQSRLASEGSLGRLEKTAPAPAREPEEGPEAGGAGPSGAGQEMTEQEKIQVQKLSQRDREVRAHEQAHVAASGGQAGSPHYEYQTGPDGRRYAVGGEVGVRRSGSSNTDQAIAEAEAVKRGALAPAQPSSQDRAVAASAEADLQRLRAEKMRRGQEGGQAEGPGGLKIGGASEDKGARDEGPAAGSGEAGPGRLAAFNGAGPGRLAAGAYLKLGSPAAVRPLLAKV